MAQIYSFNPLNEEESHHRYDSSLDKKLIIRGLYETYMDAYLESDARREKVSKEIKENIEKYLSCGLLHMQESQELELLYTLVCYPTNCCMKAY